MLELMRRGVKTWVAKILLALLIASFAVWGIGDIFTGSANSTVGVVGDTKVDAERFARTIRRQQVQMTMQRRQAVSLADMRAAGLDRQTLGTLLREAAYTEELGALGLGVSSEEVARMIRTNPAFINSQGAFDPSRYAERLGQSGFSPTEFETASRGLLGQSILSGAVRVGGAPNGVAEIIAKWQGETRGITTLALLPETAEEPETPADSVLQTFFEADGDPFREPERRWGSYLRLNVADFVKDVEVTDAEVEADYTARIDSFTTQPSRTVEQIVFRDETAAKAAATRIAEAGVSFAEIAAEQNVSVANLSLGEVGKGALPADVEKAVFSVTEPGITGPVKVLDGYALLNVTAVVVGGVTPLKDAAKDVAKALAERKAVGLVRQKATEIDEIRAGGATLAEISEKIGVPLVKFAGLGTDNTILEGEMPTLAADPRFIEEVRSSAVGDERDVVELTSGGYVLVLVDRIAEAHLPEFEAVKDKVLAAWKADQRLQALETKATELIETKGTDGLPAIATELGLEAVELPATTRTQTPPILSRDLREKIFAAKAGDLIIGRTRGDQSVVIALVREVNPLAGDTLKERVKQLEDALAGGVATDTLEFYGRALEERHGATFNQGAVDSVFRALEAGMAGGGY